LEATDSSKLALSKETVSVLARPLHAGGRLTAELRTDGNKPLNNYTFDDCDPVAESGFRQPMTWRGKSLAEISELDVRILFRLDDAELFAFDLN
jgi:hypothetical protein